MKHKTSKSKQAEWERGWIERNRLLKTLGLPKITLDQYIAELHGTVVTQPKEFRTYTPLAHVAPRARSGKQLTGSCTKTQSPTYTGTKIVGICTMHKSNMVPVFSKEEATDISNMRRTQ